MTGPTLLEPKDVLHRYLRLQRNALLSKLDGLGEREMRQPMTPTATNLLGLVKHVASIQLEYLGDVFGRPSHRPLPWLEDGSEANADMWATSDETSAEIIELHHFSAAHSDATIEALDLDSVGEVPWWPPARRQVTLHQILVHVIAETARHAGHADILRETIDGTIGDGRNEPEWGADQWAAYRSRVAAAAEEAAARPTSAG